MYDVLHKLLGSCGWSWVSHPASGGKRYVLLEAKAFHNFRDMLGNFLVDGVAAMETWSLWQWRRFIVVVTLLIIMWSQDAMPPLVSEATVFNAVQG